ncbi:MAG TPA: biotin attachment protein [Cytophagales bacterium]|nr:biotin attachment protein [Cytophagales bacterium]HRG07340.1 biotin/lipoyl-binding protein [Cyclobacteriaceae bacterium]
MKYHSISILVLLSLLVAGCNNKETVDPEGKVKLESISVTTKIAGRIEKMFVQEGQRVNKGDTLAIIHVPELAAKLEQANGAVVAAEGQLLMARHGATGDQLQQIQSQLDAANAQLEFATQSYKRMENMYNDSLVPAQKFDEVKSKYTAAKAQVDAIQAKRKEVVSARPEVITSARGQVERALGARNEVLQAASETVIVAPANMLIESVTLKEGELATPGYPVFSGYQNGAAYFRFTVGERSINAYPLGKEVTITVPGTTKSIKAKIAMVKQLPRYADNTSTAPNREIGEAFYELKIIPVQAADAAALYNNSTVLLNNL